MYRVSDRVLVIDSDESLSDTIRETRAVSPTETDTARDLESGRRFIEAHAYRAVFCDLALLETSQGDLLKILQRRNPGTPLVVTGEKKISELASEALRLGAWEALAKPASLSEVTLLLNRVQERERSELGRMLLDRDLQRAAPAWPIVAASEPMITLLEDLELASNSHAHVLLEGEPGTGKEGIVRTIHAQSARRNEPLFVVDCTQTSPDKLEDVLFASTQSENRAIRQSPRDILAKARGGSIFLNEIGVLPGKIQAKLAALFETSPYNPTDRTVGAVPVKPGARFIAASSSALCESVSMGEFRKDLYLAMSGARLVVPPLRERVQDIPLLTDHFLRHFGRSLGKPGLSICDEALERLSHYRWPGNIRELENVIERATLVGSNGPIGLRHLPEAVVRAASGAGSSGPDSSLRFARRQAETTAIKSALEATNGNRTHAAQRLGISHRSLLYKIKEYRIRK